jgi:glycosyltransferase involved in cell wall biosynthesis
MAKILIDLYKTKNVYSGLGQFSQNFANELISRPHPDLDITFLVPGNSMLASHENIRFERADLQKRYLPSLNKTYDVWHSLQQFPSHLPNKKTKQVLTIHDLNFITEKSGAKQSRYLRRLQRNADRAAVVTTISHYTRELVEKHIDLRGKEVQVIYNGILTAPAGDYVKPEFAGNKPFFFSVGLFTAKKNFRALLPLMEHFENHQLIIAGDNDTPYGREVRAEIGRLNLSDRVILPGKISDGEKYWLYASCDAFLFPSLAEGFGMPVIEAMNAGKPVFLSKYGSLPEIGGDAGFYPDRFDGSYMAAFIREKLAAYSSDQANISLRIKEHAGRFSWKTCMDGYLKLYEEILTGNKPEPT